MSIVCTCTKCENVFFMLCIFYGLHSLSCNMYLSRFVVAPAVSLDHGVDDDVPEVAGAGLARDAGHLGLVLHDEAPLDRQHIQNLKVLDLMSNLNMIYELSIET